MVRTYAYNASTQSDLFQQYKHSASQKYLPDTRSSSISQDTTGSSGFHSESGHSNNETSSVTSSNSNQNIQNNNQYNMNNHFPPINQSNIYQNSLHSSMMDQIGSIVGMRLVHMNGQLVYVPVDAQTNFLINKQFGSPFQGSTQPLHLPPIVPLMPLPYTNQNEHQQQRQDIVRSQSRQEHNGDYNNTRQDTNYEQISQQQSLVNSKPYGSLPNLSQKRFISPQEQHKIDLQQQIEDNKRRKELEKQKEFELEQREIRKWEEYQKRIREEDEREKRMAQEKAKNMEMRNKYIHEQQQEPVKKPARRQQPQQERRDSYSREYEEEPIQARRVRNSSASSYLDQHERPPSRNRRKNYRDEPERVARPDSSKPREMEWWEKKPTWQERTEGRQSALIPTLRGKPPVIPESQRSGGTGYETSGSTGSRATSSSQRSDSRGAHRLDENPNSRAAHKAPTAFVVT